MTDVTEPLRTVGTIGATLMSVNGMIGSAIFALPALLWATALQLSPA